MAEIFISYARSSESQAQKVAEALRALGYGVWRDDELPAHRAYSDVIEERLKAAKAVVVIWSAEAVRSHWVRAEADAAREAGTLVQLSIDGATPPMPFNQIQCADMKGWEGDGDAPGWRKVIASVADLAGRAATPAAPAPAQPSVPPLPDKPSIAVMPFANLSGDPAQEYFADGMVAEIVEALARFRSIAVIASGSTLALKGKGLAPAAAGRQLGVRYVLEGTVRKAGGRVRIGVQLVDCAAGAPLWSERFEDTLEDVFALQDRVAQRVAGVIAPEVREAEIRRARARPTESLSAYDLYLRAYAELRTMDRLRVTEVLELLERALAIDSAFGPALSLAAACHRNIAVFGWSDDPQDHARQALALARRAVAASGDDAEVLASASVVVMTFGDPDDAQRLADRAIAVNPGAAMALLVRAGGLLGRGETDAAMKVLDAVDRLEPVGRSSPLQLARGLALFQQERFREAARVLRGFLEVSGSPAGYALLAACCGHLGEAAQAREALEKIAAQTAFPIERFGDYYVRWPAARALYDEGIALAKALAAGG
ncbi:MAG TPA: TIR domain-containing protein [Caulobacteraceae bacterium]|nr:TIR domain-containing protein [Caulobacteraceae bacterium]